MHRFVRKFNTQVTFDSKNRYETRHVATLRELKESSEVGGHHVTLTILYSLIILFIVINDNDHQVQRRRGDNNTQSRHNPITNRAN